MAHYVRAMNDSAIEVLYQDKSVEFYHRFKLDLERNEFVLNRGTPSFISAKDLLWQGQSKYDQVAQAFWAWVLWIGIVAHPRIKSASFRVGGPPGSDKSIEHNNELLGQVAAPFKATFQGGYGIGDGYVTPKLEAGFRNESFSLEVGDVCPETLFYHVRRSHGFARWPYGSSFVYVFEVPVDLRMVSVNYLLWEHLRDCEECRAKRKSADIPEPPKTILDLL